MLARYLLLLWPCVRLSIASQCFVKTPKHNNTQKMPYDCPGSGNSSFLVPNILSKFQQSSSTDMPNTDGCRLKLAIFYQYVSFSLYLRSGSRQGHSYNLNSRRICCVNRKLADVCVCVCDVSYSIIYIYIPLMGQFFKVALCNRADHYIFVRLFLSSFFPSPNLSGRRLDVYHTLTHGVALVQI